MLRNNRKKMILSSALILLPVLVGLILWNRLPETMATHWGADGQANGWSSRAFAVFGLPLFILVLHWACTFITTKDPRNANQSEKVFNLIIWLCPVISILGCGWTYAAAFECNLNVSTAAFALIGILFLVIGNYLPKCRQNYTIGIKIPWTLANEENWNATHRMTGRVWMIGGIAMMVSAFLPAQAMQWVLPFVIVILVIVPMVYSYLYYRRQTKTKG